MSNLSTFATLFLKLLMPFIILFHFREKQNLVEEEKKRIFEREMKLLMEKEKEEKREKNRQIVLRLIVS